MVTKTYCEKPFNHINAHANGQYKLCCFATTKNPKLQKYNTKNTSPFTFFFSEEMDEIRSDMLAGKPIPDCGFCYAIEKNGLVSPRLTNVHYTKVMPHSIGVQIRIFGNACNLSCYMCFPFNSTKRNKEIKSIDTDIFETFEPEFYDRDIEVSTQDILENIDYIDYITIIGGEPFVMRPHWEFIDSIPMDKRKKIEIRYQTNLYKLQHMKWDVRDYLNDFRNVLFLVSADHYGEKHEWIRYPIETDVFENNLMEFHGNIKEIHMCLSILNIHDTKDIVDYYQNQFRIPVVIKNTVLNPRPLSTRHLPDNEKKVVTEMLKTLPAEQVPDMVYDELNKPQIPEDIEKFSHYIKQLDIKRGTNANEVFGWQIYE